MEFLAPVESSLGVSRVCFIERHSEDSKAVCFEDHAYLMKFMEEWWKGICCYKDKWCFFFIPLTAFDKQVKGF
jgi:hypothetical protein